MAYHLKKEFPAFQVMRQGKFEWRRYMHGQTYDEVPPEDAHKFKKTDMETVKHADTETKKKK